MKRRIIFHLPFIIDPNRHSASQIRPIKMLQAFKDLGYDVDCVMGTGKERKVAISEIKKKLKEGVKYDFLYSESSTMPTLLTERHHLPTYPFLDFDFFKLCRYHGIKIGLFYRDIYWCFEENIKNWKSKMAIYFYKYDLKKYNDLVDVIFIPSKEMLNYVPQLTSKNTYELPSGADIKISRINKKIDSSIELFYVGGIGSHYDLTMLIKVIRDYPNIRLTLCCREYDWHSVESLYDKILPDNVTVIHESGPKLERYYQEADICSLFVEPSTYWKFAMPYKLFEFLGHGLPVLASKGTKASEFIDIHKCGYTINYDETELRKFFDNLNKLELRKIRSNVVNFAPTQSWVARAKEVKDILSEQ